MKLNKQLAAMVLASYGSLFLFTTNSWADTEENFNSWRVLDYDVDKGSGADRFKYDMNHSGPLFALAFHW
ncbi:MAG: hypothetical protein GY875_05555 [Gammaproteobacteria bacterium]|nr:hypothetical protein [Gammaproteobacteria bacterium]